jgi:hypothetical protein
MNEFDDLLNDVLRQDGTPKPPPGMKERILAALPADRAQLSGHRAIWVGTAAVLLIGVVGGAAWTMLRTKSGPTVAPASTQVLLTRPADPARLVDSLRTVPPASAHQPNGRRLILHASIHPQPVSQQHAIRISPVAIEPLLIEPIEIASLKPGSSTMKGTIR